MALGLGTITSDATGTVWTVPITGATGVLQLSSGTVVTSLIFHDNNGYQVPIASQSLTGTGATAKVICTLCAFFSGATTVQVNTIPGNLEDSAGSPNQLGTTSNNGTTNNSTKTSTVFVYNSSGFPIYSGYWVGSTFISAVQQASGPGSQVELSFIGTDINIGTQFSNGAQISVDGGAFQTISANAGVLQKVSVSSALGLSSATHTFVLKMTGSAFWLDSVLSFEVAGFSPALSAPSNWGTQYVLFNSQNAGIQSHILPEGAWANSGQSYVAFTYQATNYPNLWQAGGFYSGQSFRFRAKISELWAWEEANAPFDLYIDGAYSASFTSSAGFVFSWNQMFTGLDATAEHVYELIVANTNNNTFHWLWALRTKGGTGIDLTYSPSARPVLAAFGDSKVVGAGVSPVADEKQLSWFQLARLGGYAYAGLGVGGTTVKEFTAGDKSAQLRIGDATAVNPAILFMDIAVNDMIQVGGTETPSDMQTAATSVLSTATSGTTFPIIWLGILPGSGGDSAPTIASWNAALVNSVATQASRSVYLDPTLQSPAWIPFGQPGSDQSDTLHPNDAGELVKYGWQLPWVSPFSISGPSSGTVGQAKTLTVTMPAGATSDGTCTYTLTDDHGVTVNITIASGQTSGTGSYTPTVAGNRTLTPTTNRLFAVPGNFAFTAASPLAGGSGRLALGCGMGLGL